MMTRETDTAPKEGAVTGPLLMEEAMVVVDAPQVHTIGKEAALTMGMEPRQILDTIVEAALTMAELQALSMTDIKGTSYSFILILLFRWFCG